VTFDFADSKTYDDALKGVTYLCMVLPASEKLSAHSNAVVDAAKKAGVKHIVRFSGLNANAKGDYILKVHGEADEYLAKSGVSYTILIPSFFTSNLLYSLQTLTTQAAFYGSAADGKTSFVDTRDLADSAIAVLLNPSAHAGKTYTLTGPAAYNDTELAAFLTKATGQEKKYVDVGMDNLGKTLLGYGMPEWTVKSLLSLDAGRKGGYTSGVTNDIETLTGHKPRTVENWITENAALFKNKEKKDEKKDEKKEDKNKKKEVTLFHIPPGRSVRPVWLVEELGLTDTVDVKILEWSSLKSDLFKKINPNGLIPALTHNGLNVFESAAIMEYLLILAGSAKSTLVPDSWTTVNWGNHLKLSYWALITLDPKFISAGFSSIAKAFGGSTSWWQNTVRPVILDQLKEGDYINGKTFSLTDIYVGFTMYWVNRAGILTEKEDKPVLAYYKRLETRPGFKKAFGIKK